MIAISMAYNRQSFFKRVRDDILSGAFQEFLCGEISVRVGQPNYWEDEVRTLLSRLLPFMDKKQVSATFQDRDKALKEIFSEMYISYDIVVKAKNKILSYPRFHNDFDAVMKLKLDDKEEFKGMVQKFLPQFSHLLP